MYLRKELSVCIFPTTVFKNIYIKKCLCDSKLTKLCYTNAQYFLVYKEYIKHPLILNKLWLSGIFPARLRSLPSVYFIRRFRGLSRPSKPDDTNVELIHFTDVQSLSQISKDAVWTWKCSSWWHYESHSQIQFPPIPQLLATNASFSSCQKTFLRFYVSQSSSLGLNIKIHEQNNNSGLKRYWSI